MLFRYKIEKRHDHICDGVNLIHYDIKIQRYDENNILFKWTTCKDTTLKSIVGILDTEYCLDPWYNALPEIHETITKYGSVDRMIAEYIRKTIMREIEDDNMMNNIEKSIDELILTNNWNTIEIKECE